jgi:hypothetical protein
VSINLILKSQNCKRPIYFSVLFVTEAAAAAAADDDSNIALHTTSYHVVRYKQSKVLCTLIAIAYMYYLCICINVCISLYMNCR